MKGIGIDCVKITRINLKYIKYLSKGELNLLDKFTSLQRKKEFCAGRWALKEAIFKALPLVGRDFSQIDISYNKAKQPVFIFPGHNFFLSLSHEKDIAIAVCVVK